MSDNLNNGFCKKHSGIVSEIEHCQWDTKKLSQRVDNVEEKTNKILNRLTYTAICFALMAVGLFANLVTKAF